MPHLYLDFVEGCEVGGLRLVAAGHGGSSPGPGPPLPPHLRRLCWCWPLTMHIYCRSCLSIAIAIHNFLYKIFQIFQISHQVQKCITEQTSTCKMMQSAHYSALGVCMPRAAVQWISNQIQSPPRVSPAPGLGRWQQGNIKQKWFPSLNLISRMQFSLSVEHGCM